jgi:hypothetical protein
MAWEDIFKLSNTPGKNFLQIEVLTAYIKIMFANPFV